MAAIISRSVSSPSTRRVHYQSQMSNGLLSLSQTFPLIEQTNLNDSFSSSSIYPNPLVTIIYSTTSSSKAVKTAEIKKHFIPGTCTFIRLIYGENQQILLNSYASCRRLLEHIKPVAGISRDETIDLIDNEGKLKELNTHYDEYASNYLIARNTYYVLKVEIDLITNEKRYIPNFNLDQIDQKLFSVLTSSLNALNKSSNKTPKPGFRTSKQNPSAQLTSNTTQSKTKRTPSRK